MTRQNKTIHYKTRQGKLIQGQDKTTQDNTITKARQDNNITRTRIRTQKQGKTRQDKNNNQTRQCNPRQDKNKTI